MVSFETEKTVYGGNLKWFIVLFFALIISSLTGVLSKFAANCDFLSFNFLVFYGLEIVLLGVYALIWQRVIKHIPLSAAYACKAFTVILALFYGAFIFGEVISVKQMIGSFVLIIGILIYVSSDSEGQK